MNKISIFLTGLCITIGTFDLKYVIMCLAAFSLGFSLVLPALIINRWEIREYQRLINRQKY